MNLFEAITPSDFLAVTFLDGSRIEGTYLTVAGHHFVQAPGATTVIGPLQDVAAVTVVKTVQERIQERVRATRGAPYPGRAPKTADDFQYRLETLAKALAREADKRRRSELENQFQDVADQIALARGKRAWVLRAAAWSLRSNEEPTFRDLWDGRDVASPGLLCRPRQQDFDPDPVVRRKRHPMPDHVRNDPRSIPNMLAALKRAGLKASYGLIGENRYDLAELQIDLPDHLSRFLAKGRRDRFGKMHWTLAWGGNTNPTALRRKRRAERLPDYVKLISIVLPERSRPETDPSLVPDCVCQHGAR